MRNTFIQQLHLPLLRAIESKIVPHADKILVAIVQILPPIDKSLQENPQTVTCLETLMRVAVK